MDKIKPNTEEMLLNTAIDAACSLGVDVHMVQRPLKQGDTRADAFRARKIAFLDTAGNAYLEQDGLLVWVKGQKRVAKPAAITVGRAFQPTGLQVLFTLLCMPQTACRRQ